MMYTWWISTMRAILGCGTWYGNEDDCMRSIYGWSGNHWVTGVVFIWRLVDERQGLYLCWTTYTQGINILVIVENGSVQSGLIGQKINSVYTCIHKFRRPPARKGPSPLSIWYISTFSIRIANGNLYGIDCRIQVNTFFYRSVTQEGLLLVEGDFIQRDEIKVSQKKNRSIISIHSTGTS